MNDNEKKKDLMALIHDAISVYRVGGRVEIDVDARLIIENVEKLVINAIDDAREAAVKELSS